MAKTVAELNLVSPGWRQLKPAGISWAKLLFSYRHAEQGLCDAVGQPGGRSSRHALGATRGSKVRACYLQDHGDRNDPEIQTLPSSRVV